VGALVGSAVGRVVGSFVGRGVGALGLYDGAEGAS